MIQTWIADVTPLLEEETYQLYYEKVPAWRKEKADRFHFQQDKALSIGAWILYEKMKKEYQLEDETVFNLSHSGHYVMCSVGDNGDQDLQVGCDIEEEKEPHLKLAKRYFCESEYRLVESKPEYFYRLWVLKESFVKATRVGLKQGLNTFEIQFTEGEDPVLVGEPYFLKEYKIEGLPYRMAVCSNKNEFGEKAQKVNL